MKKTLVLGIIMLFILVSVLPNISANVIRGDTNSRNPNTYTLIIIGFIKDKNVTVSEPLGNNASFTALLVFSYFYDNESGEFHFMRFPDRIHIVRYINYTGIFTEHFICAKFY